MRTPIMSDSGNELHHVLFMTSSIALLIGIDAVKIDAIKTRCNNGIEIAIDNALPGGVPVIHPVVLFPSGVGHAQPCRSTFLPSLLPIPPIGLRLPDAEIRDNTPLAPGATQRVNLPRSKSFFGGAIRRVIDDY